jgi:hypothetical protein
MNVIQASEDLHKKCSEMKDRRMDDIEKKVNTLTDKIEDLVSDIHELRKDIRRIGDSLETIASTVGGLGSLPEAWSRLVVIWDFVGWAQKNALRIIFLVAITYFLTTPEGLQALIKIIKE